MSTTITPENNEQINSTKFPVGGIGFVLGTLGLVLGGLLGIPASYFIQPGLLRAFMPMGKYIAEFDKIVQDKDIGSTAILGMVGCATLGVVVGVAITILIGRSRQRAEARGSR